MLTGGNRDLERFAVSRLPHRCQDVISANENERVIKAIGILGTLSFLVGSIMLARLREARMPYLALILIGLGIVLIAWSSYFWSEASRPGLG